MRALNSKFLVSPFRVLFARVSFAACLLVLGTGVGAGCSSTSDDGSGSGGQTGDGTGGKGTGGAASGTGGQVTGTGGATSGTGGASAGTGGARTGTGGTGAGGAAMGTGGAASGTGGAGTGGQGGPSTLTLTSTSLANNGTFLPANTCAGANTSPPLTWTAGPAGTQSYAMVLVDTSISRYHWAIWNLAPTVRALPAALPAGASITTPVSGMQAITGTAAPSYQGPCPNGNLHTYVFTVYALDVATLPGVATGVMAQAVFTALQTHVLASATLTGTSAAVRP